MKGKIYMRQSEIRYRQRPYTRCVVRTDSCTRVRWLVAIAACCASLLTTAHAGVANKSSIGQQGSETSSLRVLGAVIVLAVLAFAQNPLKRSDPFAGRFEGDQVALELSGANGQYTGALTIQGQKFPVTARAAGAIANGMMQAGSRNFPFML